MKDNQFNGKTGNQNFDEQDRERRTGEIVKRLERLIQLGPSDEVVCESLGTLITFTFREIPYIYQLKMIRSKIYLREYDETLEIYESIASILEEME